MTSPHLNERTIELLILGSPDIADRREETLRHVETCRHCRELYDDMREFYDALEQDADPAGLPEGSSLTIRPQYHQAVVPAPERGPVMRWVSRHRAATAGSAAVVFGALAWLASTLPTGGGSPSYVNYNIQQNLVEVYSARNEKLWHVAVNDAAVLRDAATLEPRLSRVTVTDVDADGQKEVLMAIGSTDPRLSPHQRLVTFAGSGSVRSVTGDLPQATFRGAKYPEVFYVIYYSLVRRTPDSVADVVAVLTNGRSPCVVVRYDANGKVLGEYWHFGNLLGPYLRDVDGDGRPEVVLAGSDDSAEGDEGSAGVRAVVLVLDPEKIVGRTESSVTPGFGFATSDAEKLYLRLPHGRLDRSQAWGMRTGSLIASSDSLMVFSVSTYPGDLRVMFDIVLDRELRMLRVRSTTDTELMVENLRRAGKLPTGRAAQGLLDEYRALEYWDGRMWRSERVEVQRPAGTAHRP